MQNKPSNTPPGCRFGGVCVSLCVRACQCDFLVNYTINQTQHGKRQKKEKKILAMKQRRWSNMWHYLTANLGTQVCVCVFVCAHIIILGIKST